jgi:hypothetical protein
VSPVRYELGFISQKTAFFIVTAVKTSNFTCGYGIKVVPSSPILVTLMKEALYSSAKSVLTRIKQTVVPVFLYLQQTRTANYSSLHEAYL